MSNEVDILENEIRNKYPEVLEILLRDHTTQKNIFWATDNYREFGSGYEYDSPILPELITGERGHIIMPRVKKDKLLQQMRVRDMAEVFTPLWICNAQNNLIDEAWFGRKNVFNTEIINSDGVHSWKPNPVKITFPDNKTWKDYVRDTRLEITCGEAPYITSRYDTNTGEYIPVENRIGILDRKLRVVSENTDTTSEWLDAAQTAYKNTYAFEWQGDNLLLAREAMLYTFIDNYIQKFRKPPQLRSIRYIAYIISWNVWQMDGLKGVVPNSCSTKIATEPNLFGEIEIKETPCEGCFKDNIRRHNGIYCLIKDWEAKDTVTNKKGGKIRFIDLIPKYKT
ncbi:MAG: Putative type II DNA modification methyltransferase [Bacteroidetes bacterium 38_7]|nr:MAG: Putative type II DNA modification methyltransferase [Bacteroidetes bacterium 38_7]HAL65750.1 restriction endonuclease subunit M [Bacteroidales bacterium]